MHSQPTISRLENLADARALHRIGIDLIDLFCGGYAVRPPAITLNLDETGDLFHGGQQSALFNTHTRGLCFKPIHIFEGNSCKPILSLIKPGLARAPSSKTQQAPGHTIRR